MPTAPFALRWREVAAFRLPSRSEVRYIRGPFATVHSRRAGASALGAEPPDARVGVEVELRDARVGINEDPWEARVGLKADLQEAGVGLKADGTRPKETCHP